MSEGLEPPIGAADAAAYEQRLLAAVRASLPQHSDKPVAGLRGQAVVFDEVAVAGEFPDSVLVVYVRDPSRSECVFGFWRHLWTVGEQDRRVAGVRAAESGPPERVAARLAAEAEDFLTVGLPGDCDAGEVTRVTARSRQVLPDYYAARLVAALGQRYASRPAGEHFAGRAQRCWVEDVFVDGVYPGSQLVVLVRDGDRPECTFGFRLAVWNQDGRPAMEDHWPTPEDHAWILAINLEEDVEAAGYGLPAQCAPGEVTWVR